MKPQSLCLLLLIAAPLPAMASPEPPAESAPAAEPKVENLKPAEAAKRLQEKSREKPAVTILDVRTPDEFRDGHLKGATNIDFNADAFETKLAALDRSKPVLVHCAAGGRSTRSLKTLKKLGFQTILHLDGGYNAWKEAGLPVEKPAKP